MGQVHVRVVLTNHREAVMAQFGQLDANRVHYYETEALIDTGATHSSSLRRSQIVSGFFGFDAQMRNMPIAALRKSM